MSRGAAAASHAAAASDVTAALTRAGQLLASGHTADAIEAYRAVLARRPGLWRARYLLTLALMAQRSYDVAVEEGRRAVIDAGEAAEADERAEMLTSVAVALNEAGRHAEALEPASLAAALAPSNVHALAARARALSGSGRADEAVATARQLLALDGEHGMPHALLGELLMEQGRLASALSSLERAIRYGYETTEVRNRLGLARKWLGDADGALAEQRRAMELEPGWAPGYSNLAASLADLGAFDAAMELHRIAIEMAPDDAARHNDFALALLARGDLDRGWREFEWGMEGSTRGRRRELGVAHWDGSHPSGRRVLVHQEQGVGDEIMFASCLDDLLAEATHVVVECDPRLVSLFARSFPAATVRADTRDSATREETLAPDEIDFDLVAPIGSLPLRYRRRLDAFPDRRSYLRADPELVAAWRAWLDGLGAGPAVGISWRSRLSGRERRLEYTRLTDWEPVFSIPGVRFVNVQYDEVDQELAEAGERFGLEIARPPGLDLMNDFEGVAALVCALDAVISPQNTLGHLAGALGVPTLMMGNRFWWNNLGATRAPGSTRYPWLPAVTLVTRDPREPWEPVLADAGRRVARLAARAGGDAA